MPSTIPWIETLQRSGQMLIEHPKILLPKLIVAALYGLLLIWTAQNLTIFSSPQAIDPAQIQQLARFSVLSLGLSLLALVVDILVNAMYPVIVNQINSKKSVSLGKAFGEALEHASKIIPLNVVVIVIFALVLTPFLVLVLYSKYWFPDSTTLATGIGLLVMGVLGILMFAGFYFSNTIVVIEKRGVWASMRKSVEMGKKYFRDVTGLSLVSLVLALISMYLAFAIADLGAGLAYGIAFIALRLITVVLYTYQYVLSPVLYFQLNKTQKLGRLSAAPASK
jgi:hypothetical protein